MWQIIDKDKLTVVFTGQTKQDAIDYFEENGLSPDCFKIKKRLVAGNARTAKQKGSKYEREIAQLYVEFGIDPNAGRMPLSGASNFLKGDIRKAHNAALEYRFVDEVKRQENLAIPIWWKQAVSQCTIGEEPLLHFKKNDMEGLSILRTRTLFSLMGKIVYLTNQLEICQSIENGFIPNDKDVNKKFIKDALYQMRYAKEAIKKAEKALGNEVLT